MHGSGKRHLASFSSLMHRDLFFDHATESVVPTTSQRRQQVLVEDGAVADIRRSCIFPKLDRRETPAERSGLLDAGRKQFEPSAQALFALPAIGLTRGLCRARSQGRERRRPAGDIAHLLEAGEAGAVVNDGNALARQQTIDGGVRSPWHRCINRVGAANEQKGRSSQSRHARPQPMQLHCGDARRSRAATAGGED